MSTEGRQRIDKWLFFARVVKSRSLAARLVQGGGVRVNRMKIDQAAYAIKVGDVLTIALERHVLVYRILNPGIRRGPAPEAQTLYEDMTPKPTTETGDEMASHAQRDAGSGRPTKKERRALDALIWRN